MPNHCPRCGSEMVHTPTGEWIESDAIIGGKIETIPAERYEWRCPLHPKDCHIAELERQLEEAKANYQFMVDRAADEKLDGYRELGARASQAENALDAYKAFHFAIGKALGMMYEADGHNDEPASMSELLDAIKRQLSERDAALAQVGAKAELINAIAFASAKKWGVPSQEFYEQFQPWAQNLCRHHIAHNTSATAQQFVQRIKEETVWKAWDYLREGFEHLQTVDGYATIKGAIKFQLFSAAILGEKENN